MSDPERVPPSGGPGHWRRWLLPVLASAAWLVLTFCLYRHAVQGEQAHLLELCHTRLAATAHQLMDARDWNAGHGGVYVPLSAYGEPNPWLPEKDRTLQTADGRTLVLMNPAYMSRQMAERLTEPGFRLAIVGQAPLRPGNRADDWERRILATATQGGQVFFSGEDCLPQGRLRLLRTLAAQESCLRCHQGHKEGDMLGGISISMDAAAYVRDLERKQRELGLLYGLLALTGVLAVGGITSNLTLRRLQAEEKSRLKSAFMGRLSHDMRTPLAAMLGMSDLLDRQDCGTEQRHTALAYLRRACGALLEMVDDITDHASLEQGDVRLRCRTFDLPACLRACADLYRPAAEGKGLELLLHLAPHLPRQVRGDGFRLRQALGNLVSNAVKFTERGRVDVEAGGERLASGVFLLRLDVRDSGPGLEPGEEARFRSLGVRALLDKPVPPAMLLAALRDVPRGCPGDGRAGPTPCGAEAEAPVIWDRAAALAAADQDEELLHTLVTALRDDLPRLEATLEAGRKLAADPAVPAARTAEALRRAAHALKNSAATLCFEELRLRAAALEQAARQVLADTPENAAGLGSLAAACAGALARAEEALRRDNG